MGSVEHNCRRPEWAGGTPLLLPDGQVWWFYEPRPRVVEVGGTSAVLWDWGVSAAENVALTEALYRVLGKLVRALTDAERVGAVCDVAWLMLARNYEVAPDEFEAALNAGPISAGLWRRMEQMVVALNERAVAAQKAVA